MNLGNTASQRQLRPPRGRTVSLATSVIAVLAIVVLAALLTLPQLNSSTGVSNNPVANQAGSSAGLPDGIDSLAGVQPIAEFSGTGSDSLTATIDAPSYVLVWDYKVTGVFDHDFTVSTGNDFVWTADGGSRFFESGSDNRSFVVLNSNGVIGVDIKSSGVEWELSIFPLPLGR